MIRIAYAVAIKVISYFLSAISILVLPIPAGPLITHTSFIVLSIASTVLSLNMFLAVLLSFAINVLICLI